MKVQFIYPAFDRHAQSHPELREFVPCNEYIGPPSLGIASVAAATPAGIEVAFVDDRIHPVTERLPEADLYALSFFTPAATRALEIGDFLRARKKTVVMGGIFPTMMPDECEGHCDALVQGEGEPVWPELLADFAAGRLKKRYRAAAPADLETLPPPRVDLYLDAESAAFAPDDYPLQTSRGCPFACDCCVLPDVMGKKIRHFPESTVEKTLLAFAARGKLCSLTEDTSFMFVAGARRRFRALLRALAERYLKQGARLSYIGCSMPLLLNVEPEVLAEVRRAGIDRFYLVCGFDPITREAFGRGEAAAMAKAEECIRRCHEVGVEPYISLLAGNDSDDRGVFDRILSFCERTRIQTAEFVVATPYPGTPMWRKLQSENRILDRTWKRYNDANVVFRPAQMSPEELQEGYLRMWREFYRSRKHLAQADRGRRTIQF
ncbi:MAG: B12-binding domain-containing radical SAM protein [Myxococcales bacterium]|nr:B12-binding domain-containing radical SAM protein [Myxococcales bacterium]